MHLQNDSHPVRYDIRWTMMIEEEDDDDDDGDRQIIGGQLCSPSVSFTIEIQWTFNWSHLWEEKRKKYRDVNEWWKRNFCT